MTKTIHSNDVQAALRSGTKIGLLDVRDEGPFAEAHPLFAASFPLGRLELEALDRLPRFDVPLVVYDAGEGFAAPAVARLSKLGYRNVALLEGGLDGWRAAGGELFRDVNVPSKAFGELVESVRHTSSIAAEDLRAKLDAGADMVILDARRFEEYRTMSIPAGTSVPGGELVYRITDLAPRPETLVIVNCAGRTRSIIGAQSLINAGIPNQVAALRNGTIGWTLAGLPLDRGQARRFSAVSHTGRKLAKAAARRLAARASVRRLAHTDLVRLSLDASRTLYRFDVRTPEEYVFGHPPGFRSAPGGQLVQETDFFAPIRGARIVLADDDGARADMTASWLAQMGWDVSVLDTDLHGVSRQTGPWVPKLPPFPSVIETSSQALAHAVTEGSVTVIDVGGLPDYLRGHVPGAWLVPRAHLKSARAVVPLDKPVVLTSADDSIARLAAPEFAELFGVLPRVLSCGVLGWIESGNKTESGSTRVVAGLNDVYKRPYEGTDNPREAMQGYLEWEYGLVAQLGRDGTHGFKVLLPD